MGKTLIASQQARETLWESGVMGGENQSLKTPDSLEGHVGKLGFWLGKITKRTAHIQKCLNWGLSPPAPLFIILLF